MRKNEEEEVGPEAEGKIPIYVAGGFDQATMDEYVYAGGAMKRRGCYQVGSKLKPGVDGKVSVGCGLDQVANNQDISVVTVTRQGLLDLIQKKEDALKQFETQDNNFWEKLLDSIVNLGEYRNFNIVEP